MAAHSQKKVFETIEGHLREHKIVTFKWLSRKLKLHITFAKQYLNEWVEKNSQNEYVVSYTVFGKKENGELLLMLTQETAEDYFKSKNISVIKRYVYSIHSSDTNFEPASIYNIDKSTYESRQMGLSSINYHTEIISKSSKIVGTSVVVNGTNKGHVNSMKNYVCKTPHPEENGSSVGECGDSGSNNFFKALSKETDTIKGSKIVSMTKEDKNKPSLTKKPKAGRSANAHGSITNFFGKRCTVIGAEDEVEEIETGKPVEIEVNSVTQVVKIDDAVDTEEISVKDVESECAAEAREKICKSKKSSKKDFTKKTRKSKQMKRIIMPLDSESDGESNDSDTSLNLDEITEPEPNIVDFSEPELGAHAVVADGKKRKRTVIEESEIDEEGFMHTSKKVIYESCDDEDELEGVSDQRKSIQCDTSGSVPSEKKAKIEPSTKKKQSSILSFFQKPA